MEWRALDPDLNVLGTQAFNLDILKPLATVTIDNSLAITYDIGSTGGALQSTAVPFTVAPSFCET